MATLVKRATWHGVWRSVLAWFDTSAMDMPANSSARTVNWLRTIPFVGMHLACLAVIWVGWSPVAVGTAVALYLLRMFAITGF